jgi:hypothetical protein
VSVVGFAGVDQGSAGHEFLHAADIEGDGLVLVGGQQHEALCGDGDEFVGEVVGFGDGVIVFAETLESDVAQFGQGQSSADLLGGLAALVQQQADA